MKILGKAHKKNTIKAFTLMEVIIATIIFSLAMAGVFASVSQLRAPAVESSQEVTAAFLGKQILEDLRTQIDAQTWNITGGNLEVGPIHTGVRTVGGRDYNYNYSVIGDPDGTSARQVTLNVSW